MRRAEGVDGGDVRAVLAHRVEVCRPAGEPRRDAVADADDDDQNQRRDRRAPLVAPRRNGQRHQPDQQVLRTESRRDGHRRGAEQEVAAQQQRHGNDHQHHRRHVAERAAAVEPDVRKKRQDQRRAERGAESHAQRAAQEDHRRHDQDRGEEAQRLQRVKVVEAKLANDLRREDVQRKAGRVRVVRGDVVAVERAHEKQLVPVPRRTRQGEDATDRRRHRRRDQNPALAPHCAAGCHVIDVSFSASSRVSPPGCARAGTTASLEVMRSSFAAPVRPATIHDFSISGCAATK